MVTAIAASALLSAKAYTAYSAMTIRRRVEAMRQRWDKLSAPERVLIGRQFGFAPTYRYIVTAPLDDAVNAAQSKPARFNFDQAETDWRVQLRWLELEETLGVVEFDDNPFKLNLPTKYREKVDHVPKFVSPIAEDCFVPHEYQIAWLQMLLDNLDQEARDGTNLVKPIGEDVWRYFTGASQTQGMSHENLDSILAGLASNDGEKTNPADLQWWEDRHGDTRPQRVKNDYGDYGDPLGNLGLYWLRRQKYGKTEQRSIFVAYNDK